MECNCLNHPGLSCTCTFGPFRQSDPVAEDGNIKVTPEMIDAGVEAYCFGQEYASSEEIVAAIYRAMRAVEPPTYVWEQNMPGKLTISYG